MPGDSQQTTSSSSEPWKVAQPALKTAVTGAEDLYKKGVGGKVYTGSTVIPWDQQTKKGMNFIQSGANANLAGKGLSGQYQDVINNGGYTDDQRQSANVMSGVMNGSGLSADQEAALGTFRNGMTNGLTNEQRQAMSGMGDTIANGGYNAEQRAALQSAQGMLGGDGLSAAQRQALGGLQSLAGNPFNDYQNDALNNSRTLANSSYAISPELQKVLDAQSAKVTEAVNANASGAGRYGSGANQNLLASNIGDLTNSTVYNDYTNFLGRKDAANSNLFNMGQTGVNTQMSANQGAAGIGQQGIGNRQNAESSVFNMGQNAQGNLANAQNALFGMGQTDQTNRSNAATNAANLGQTGITNRTNAATSLNNMAQQAFGNLGNAYTGMQAPANDLMKIGGMNEDLATRKMNDKLRIFNEQQNKPWDQLGRLNAIASGAGQMGGTQTQSQPGQNPFLTAMGYGATGAGLLGGFL